MSLIPRRPENKGIFPRCYSLFAQRFASCLFPHLPPAPLGIFLIGSVSFLHVLTSAGIISYVLITRLSFNQRLTGHTISLLCISYWILTGGLLDGESWGCGRTAGGLKQKSQRLLCLKGEKKKKLEKPNQEKLKKKIKKRQLKRRKAKTCSAFALTWFQLIRLLYTMNITSTLYL